MNLWSRVKERKAGAKTCVNAVNSRKRASVYSAVDKDAADAAGKLREQDASN